MSFCKDNDRLDEFWADQLASTKYKAFWSVVKMLLDLSHGQASVERGFSFNKNLMETNMSETTIKALPAIADHLQYVGGMQKVEVTKKLLFSTSQAHQRYKNALDEKQEKRDKEKKNLRKKAEFDEIDDLKKKKRRIEDNMKALIEEADSFAEKAEDKGDIRLLAKYNALRKSAKEKESELQILKKLRYRRQS